MNNGVVIFAHNSRAVDYILTAIVAGHLAKKNLNVPVSLITDETTLDWAKESKIYDTAIEVFDKIIKIEKPVTDNKRTLNDGNKSKVVPFFNSSRSDVWDLTPYDRTLLIDSDFLIFSNNLSSYWEVDADVMISASMNDIRGDRIGTLDKWVSDEGIPLLWATTVMFTKNSESRLFFDLVKTIKENYNIFSNIYRFNPSTFRNDIAFSIAKHILDGFETNRASYLPPILTAQDKDLIQSVSDNGIRVLIQDPLSENAMSIANIIEQDVHVMNKEAIVRCSKMLMEIL
jgi:hypothetical protein